MQSRSLIPYSRLSLRRAPEWSRKLAARTRRQVGRSRPARQESDRRSPKPRPSAWGRCNLPLPPDFVSRETAEPLRLPFIVAPPTLDALEPLANLIDGYFPYTRIMISPPTNLKPVPVAM